MDKYKQIITIEMRQNNWEAVYGHLTPLRTLIQMKEEACPLTRYDAGQYKGEIPFPALYQKEIPFPTRTEMRTRRTPQITPETREQRARVATRATELVKEGKSRGEAWEQAWQEEPE